jgi:hypothetical protein
LLFFSVRSQKNDRIDYPIRSVSVNNPCERGIYCQLAAEIYNVTRSEAWAILAQLCYKEKGEVYLYDANGVIVTYPLPEGSFKGIHYMNKYNRLCIESNCGRKAVGVLYNNTRHQPKTEKPKKNDTLKEEIKPATHESSIITEIERTSKEIDKYRGNADRKIDMRQLEENTSPVTENKIQGQSQPKPQVQSLPLNARSVNNKTPEMQAISQDHDNIYDETSNP